MSIFKTLDHLAALGRREGQERGGREGQCEELNKLLQRHGKRLFGPPPESGRELLDALADRVGLEQLESLVGRFAGAGGWAPLLEGLAVPAERPAEPPYLLPYEFDPSPTTPAIDHHQEVRLLSGGKAIIHLRLQKHYQDNIGQVLYKESRRMRLERGCEVKTVVLLLWPEADGPAMTGEYQVPGGEVFEYHLTRLWEKDVDEMFASPATLSYTPLARFDPARLPEVVRRMGAGIDALSRDEETRANLWFLAFAGMGVRYPVEQVHELLAHKLDYLHNLQMCKRTRSDGYHEGRSQGGQDGKLAGARRWVVLVGTARLGEPDEDTVRALESIRSLERLEQVAARVLKVGGWREVFLPG